MSQTLLMRREGAVAVLTLNRPEKMNAMSLELRAALAATLTQLEGDDDVRVVVLTGAGDRAFCAGMDLKELGAPIPAGLTSVDPYAAVDRFAKPIIAAVNGVCVTGGLELILVCDIVIASTAAKFADTHVRLGVLPGSSGITQRLAHQIGPQRAKEMLLTGNYVGAQRAFDLGLVNRVVEPEALLGAALAIAQDIASANFGAVMAYKDALDDGFQETVGAGVSVAAQKARDFSARTSRGELDSAKSAVLTRGRTQID